MKIRISYPGQPVQVIDAPSHIVQHFLLKDWPLPFIKIVSVGP
jgi:hypothetical protein